MVGRPPASVKFVLENNKNMAKKISSENLSAPEATVSDAATDKSVGITNEKILAQLQINEKLNRDILKSVRFIRHYYAWRSLVSVIKYCLLAAVIVLGLISWRGIVEYVNQSVSGNNSTFTNLILN